MVRFINIGDQITLDEPDKQFAWFNTIVDRFMDFGGDVVWDTWDNFVESYNVVNPWGPKYPLERFEGLFRRKWRKE